MNFGFLKYKLTLPAFESRNYQLYFTGQGLSLIGTWMTQVATVWIAYDLTHSPLMLGLVGFVRQLPNFFLVPFGGVLVDRWNHHRTLLVTQTLSMLQSFALAILALTGVIQFWHLIALCLLQGVINAIDSPTRQAFVPELVERREKLGNAIALNSSIFSSARLIGPAIAGLLIAAVGTGTCFLIDGLSYIAVILGLLAMRLPPLKGGIAPSSATILQRLKEGFDYAFGFPPIRSILLLIALVSFFGMPYTTLAPIFAREILQGGPETLGFLMAASGLGALISAVYLSTRPSVLGLTRLIAIAPAVFGAALITFAFSRVLWLSLLATLLLGMSLIMQHTAGNTVLQTIVEEDKRGRVLSFYLMAFTSMVTFGNLLAGTLASWIGAPNTLVVGGILCIAGSLVFIRQLPNMRNHIRPIYRKIGVLPSAPT